MMMNKNNKMKFMLKEKFIIHNKLNKLNILIYYINLLDFNHLWMLLHKLNQFNLLINVIKLKILISIIIIIIMLMIN